MRWREWDVKLVKSANDRKSRKSQIWSYICACVRVYVCLNVSVLGSVDGPTLYYLFTDANSQQMLTAPSPEGLGLSPLQVHRHICASCIWTRVSRQNVYHLCVSVCVRRRKIKQSVNFERLLERMRARTCTLTCILIVCGLWPVHNSLQVKARLTFEMNRLIQASWSHLAFITRKQCNIAWILSLVNTRRRIGLPTLFGPLSSSISRCNLNMIYRVILYTCICVTGLMHTWHVHHHKNVKSFVFYKIKA